jgi:hypothetical protein
MGGTKLLEWPRLLRSVLVAGKSKTRGSPTLRSYKQVKITSFGGVTSINSLFIGRSRSARSSRS